MKRFNIATYVLVAIFVFVFIPFGIAFLVSFNFINTDTSNEWIGFWGGYLGSILGGAITLFVLFKTLKDGERLQKREEKLAYCDRIADIVADYYQEIPIVLIKINKYYNRVEHGIDNINTLDELTEALNVIQKNEFVLTVQLYSKIKDKDYKNINEIISIVKNVTNLLAPICDRLRKQELDTIDRNDLQTILKNIEAENYRLFNETILFLTNNKEL